MRRSYVAANWKMHLDGAAVDAFCARLPALAREAADVRIGIFPPSVYLARVVGALAGRPLTVGAQAARPEERGAFTGEIAARQVKDVGAGALIVGHSERRTLFGETDADVRARLDAALALGLDVIFCLGESLAERKAGRTDEVVLAQLQAGLAGLSPRDIAQRVTIAYEPVWAIGTGLVATPDQAQQVHALLRAAVARLADEATARAVVIQYGGSVKPDNFAELIACPDVDGALVGGASLDVSMFEALVRLGSGSAHGAGRN